MLCSFTRLHEWIHQKHALASRLHEWIHQKHALTSKSQHSQNKKRNASHSAAPVMRTMLAPMKSSAIEAPSWWRLHGVVDVASPALVLILAYPSHTACRKETSNGRWDAPPAPTWSHHCDHAFVFLKRNSRAKILRQQLQERALMLLSELV